MIPKPGNPHGKPRPTLHNVSAKLDEETYQQLCKLEALLPNVNGRRSDVIRCAIHEKYERIRKQK